LESGKSIIAIIIIFLTSPNSSNSNSIQLRGKCQVYGLMLMSLIAIFLIAVYWINFIVSVRFSHIDKTLWKLVKTLLSYMNSLSTDRCVEGWLFQRSWRLHKPCAPSSTLTSTITKRKRQPTPNSTLFKCKLLECRLVFLFLCIDYIVC